MSNFTLSIISPERILFEGQARSVTAPGTEGEFGVLGGHSPFLTTLRPGIITVEQADGSTMKIGVLDGFVEANPESCIILSGTARNLDTITRAEAEAELKDAREDISLATDETAKDKAQKRMVLAEAILAKA